jgi:photoactive yellow protein
MDRVARPSFEQPGVETGIEALNQAEFDSLEFGIIGFDGQDIVRVYNKTESQAAGLSLNRVIGQPLFTVVAPCMNNYLVGQRFADAAVKGSPLDAIIDYVLTLRMRPVQVKLRLLASPASALRYVLVQRQP